MLDLKGRLQVSFRWWHAPITLFVSAILIIFFRYGGLFVPWLGLTLVVENCTDKPISEVSIYCGAFAKSVGTIPPRWKKAVNISIRGEAGGVSVTCKNPQGELWSGGFSRYLEGYPGEVTARVDAEGKFSFEGIPNFLFPGLHLEIPVRSDGRRSGQ